MNTKIKKGTVDKSSQDLPYVPKTPLGKKLLKIRARITAKGEPLLNWEEIEKEVADRRKLL